MATPRQSDGQLAIRVLGPLDVSIDRRPDEAMAHLKRAVTLFADIGGLPGELEPEIWKLVTF